MKTLTNQNEWNERADNLLARARARQLELALAGDVRTSAVYAARVERIQRVVRDASDDSLCTCAA